MRKMTNPDRNFIPGYAKGKVEGYNDQPKPCLNKDCEGMVRPTYSPNVGRCGVCSEQFGWSQFQRTPPPTSARRERDDVL